MVINKEASVEIKTNAETGIRSALIRNKDDKIIYSTSDEQEIEPLDLLSEGKQFAIDYFISKEPKDNL